MSKNYLFICGCGRSGTSALAYLVGAHPKIAMGVERYHHLVIPELKLDFKHFTKKRFYDFRKTDTHVRLPVNAKIRRQYKELHTRFKKAKWVGDKIPLLHRQFESLSKHFSTRGGKVKFLFIVRNAIDVLNSYNIRFKDPDDPWVRDMELGIRDWNLALADLKTALEKGIDVHIVEYEDAFDISPRETTSRINQFLGLQDDPAQFQRLDQLLATASKLKQKRKEAFSLTSSDKRHILKSANIGLYRRLTTNEV